MLLLFFLDYLLTLRIFPKRLLFSNVFIKYEWGALFLERIYLYLFQRHFYDLFALTVIVNCKDFIGRLHQLWKFKILHVFLCRMFITFSLDVLELFYFIIILLHGSEFTKIIDNIWHFLSLLSDLIIDLPIFLLYVLVLGNWSTSQMVLRWSWKDYWRFSCFIDWQRQQYRNMRVRKLNPED